MNAWRRFHDRPIWQRAAVKTLAFLLVLLLVLFPKPWLLVTLLHRSTHMGAMIEPDHPALAPLEAQVRAAGPDLAPNSPALLDIVQDVVNKRVRYAFDWETHGVVEYLPTVGEVLQIGREDCDGRAVVAASLLRRMGVQADLVTDFLHMWVVTPAGATMGPTSSRPAIRTGPDDGKPDIRTDWSLLTQFARGWTFGIAVFPWPREAIIVAALALITLHPRTGLRRFVIGAALLAGAVPLVRLAGAGIPHEPLPYWPALSAAGLACFMLGWLILLFRGRAGPPHSAPAPPG